MHWAPPPMHDKRIPAKVRRVLPLNRTDTIDFISLDQHGHVGWTSLSINHPFKLRKCLNVFQLRRSSIEAESCLSDQLTYC